jgi:hypothetical protein
MSAMPMLRQLTMPIFIFQGKALKIRLLYYFES